MIMDNQQITVYIFNGFNDYKKIGGIYEYIFEAMSYAKEYAKKFGTTKTFIICTDNITTHFVKSNGIYLELSELPANTQTKLN